MQAGRAALPEFDGFRRDAVASPERGQRDLAVVEFLADLGEFLHEEFPRSDDLALVGNPGADLRFARTRGKVSQGLGGADFFRRALNDDLALKGDPREEQ